MDIYEYVRVKVRLNGNNTNPYIDVYLIDRPDDDLQMEGYRIRNRGEYKYVNRNGKIQKNIIADEIKSNIIEKQPRTHKETREIIDEVIGEFFEEIQDMRKKVLRYDNVELYYTLE